MSNPISFESPIAAQTSAAAPANAPLQATSDKTKTFFQRLFDFSSPQPQPQAEIDGEFVELSLSDFDPKADLAALWTQTKKDGKTQALHHFIKSMDESNTSKEILDQLIDHISNSRSLRSELNHPKWRDQIFDMYMKNNPQGDKLTLAQSFFIKTAPDRNDIYYTVVSMQSKFPEDVYKELIKTFPES